MKVRIPKEIPVIFHNGLNYDYHFIIKELVKGFEEEFNGLRQNIEKYKTFPVPIINEVKRIDKNRKEITKAIYHKSEFIDTARFMASSLSDIIDNLA